MSCGLAGGAALRGTVSEGASHMHRKIIAHAENSDSSNCGMAWNHAAIFFAGTGAAAPDMTCPQYA